MERFLYLRVCNITFFNVVNIQILSWNSPVKSTAFFVKKKNVASKFSSLHLELYTVNIAKATEKGVLLVLSIAFSPN